MTVLKKKKQIKRLVEEVFINLLNDNTKENQPYVRSSCAINIFFLMMQFLRNGPKDVFRLLLLLVQTAPVNQLIISI